VARLAAKQQTGVGDP